MIEYKSIHSIMNHEKKEFKPTPITIDFGYNRIDAEYVFDIMRDTINEKGYMLVSDLCAIADLVLDYDQDELEEYGWDSKRFDVSDLMVLRKDGRYYIDVPAPIKMAP